MAKLNNVAEKENVKDSVDAKYKAIKAVVDATKIIIDAINAVVDITKPGDEYKELIADPKVANAHAKYKEAKANLDSLADQLNLINTQHEVEITGEANLTTGI
jgi:hypothetical protein